jgi:hypothetical protein
MEVAKPWQVSNSSNPLFDENRDLMAQLKELT